MTETQPHNLPKELSVPKPRRRCYYSEELSEEYGAPPPTLIETTLKNANLISSRLDNGNHVPTLDLDVPHYFVPSSTPGHSHLYIDVPMSWRKYKRLLRALYRAGIIERGFYKFSVRRGASFVRKPGIKK